MPTNTELYERVTDVILDALDKGIVPWHKPWRPMRGYEHLHMNMVTKRPYRGVNQFMCELQAAINSYASPYWLSKKQINERKGKIRKGERGTLIVFWKPIRIKTDEVDEKGQPIMKKVLLLKHYFVWNVDQCDGIKLPAPTPEAEQPTFDPIASGDAIIAGMPSAPEIFHNGGDRAYYSPSDDTLHLPVHEAFVRNTAYYATTFHELGHATGHESRLGRVKEWGSFGSDPYAKEELVAELASAMLCTVAGIEAEYKQTVGYIQSWAARFRQDKKLIIQAAGQAQKASDYILGMETTYEENTETNGTMAHA